MKCIIFSSMFVLAGIVSYFPVLTLFQIDLHGEYYSHIILIPFISAYFIYDNRKSIISDYRYSFSAGIPVMITAVLLFFAGQMLTYLKQNDLASVTVFSAVVFVNGAFIMTFGMKAFKSRAVSFAVPGICGADTVCCYGFNHHLFTGGLDGVYGVALYGNGHFICTRGVCFSFAGTEY